MEWNDRMENGIEQWTHKVAAKSCNWHCSIQVELPSPEKASPCQSTQHFERGNKDVMEERSISTQDCHTYIIHSYLSLPCPRETGSNDTEITRTRYNKKAPDLSKPLLPPHIGYDSIALYIWILSSPCTLSKVEYVQHQNNLVPELHNYPLVSFRNVSLGMKPISNFQVHGELATHYIVVP